MLRPHVRGVQSMAMLTSINLASRRFGASVLALQELGLAMRLKRSSTGDRWTRLGAARVQACIAGALQR